MAGYEGVFCDEPYCQAQKCQNGARCDVLDQVNYQRQFVKLLRFDNTMTFIQTPQCTCPPGYNGRFCEKNIDDCAPDADGNLPCQNYSNCIDGVNSFTCNCTGTGFTGLDCSIDVDECQMSSTDCGRGTCENVIGLYRCLCDDGYCGVNCNMENYCAKEVKLCCI